MPTRILREGILTSERVNSLGWGSEVFYRRLMSVVDDYGRYYAKPALLRAACYPLKLEKVSDSDIDKWISECEEAGLVRVYTVLEDAADRKGSPLGGKPDGGSRITPKKYLELLDFRQRMRSKESKFPSPTEHAEQLHSTCKPDDNHMSDTCLTSDSHMSDTCPTHDSHVRAKTEAESKSKTEAESKSKTEAESKSKTKRSKRFKAPTPSEVESYAKSINFDIDGEHFVDYYAARGWMIGKTHMKDWKAAVRTWKRTQGENHGRFGSTQGQRGIAPKTGKAPEGTAEERTARSRGIRGLTKSVKPEQP